MKKNLRSTCLLILVFLSFITGFAGLGSAENVSYNYSFDENNYTGKWDKDFSSPVSEYKIWGYPNKNYTFITTYNRSLFSDKRVIVFYWDCNNNTSDHTPPIPMSGNCSNIGVAYQSNCTHKWDKIGTYYVSAAIFQDGIPINVSYWVPVEIRNNTCITVQNFSMLDEKEGFDSNNSAHIYKISNFTEIMLDGEEEFNCNSSTYNLDNSSKNCCYCGYKDNDYSFSTCLNATCGKRKNIPALPETDIRTPTRADIQKNLSETDTRTIMETTTVIEWDNNSSDNSIFGNISYSNETEDALAVSNNNASIKSNNSTAYIQWNENFTHEWDDTGIKTINATSFHWDPLDGNESNSNYKNKSILIISDPKNLAPYPLIGNLQNWGILLSILGLIIFYFTYTRNNIPIKIALFGMKPFYLKSVNSLTGTLIFVAGMYLCFVFGRCPWDIPIVSSSNWLSNMYFSILYREYGIKQWSVPYLSILIGMLDVIILSLIIHMIAIPFYKGEFKIGEFLRRKITSTSAQPKLVSCSVENK
ncbi:hypothetical protein RG963_03385 [Methanosarcina sp. Z-7115]|uniref:Uncharacterized protein n=1 Tax=Methanosarcina baikalica TaxID=3073890 RepID=A0ABU2CYN1_9EURY|nr:hypothetical protein [Methanosarcina sp. Z-7115]MDR7664843.1 hypothetical protein [Methanosarcina sp. Z-7115]